MNEWKIGEKGNRENENMGNRYTKNEPNGRKSKMKRGKD